MHAVEMIAKNSKIPRKGRLQRLLRHCARALQRPRALVSALIVSTVIGVIGCGSSSPPVVYTSEVDGNLEIYAISIGGKQPQNLTKSPQDEFSPRVAPNGKLIAFMSSSGKGTVLEVMKIDGGSRRRLTEEAEIHRSHRWSPDSRRIAYVTQDGSETLIYVTDVDDTEPSKVVTEGEQDVGSWSPDGDLIALVAPGNGIWTRNPDGVNRIQLTETDDTSPIWSPDSREIAFLSTRDGNTDIYVMNADGTQQRRLTNDDASEGDISWSPDSKRILYGSDADGDPEIYTVEVKEGKVKKLTSNNGIDRQPVWSPDGRKIAFVSLLDGDPEIFVMDLDGGTQDKLTNNSAEDSTPSW